ncbi:MAG: metalloregulator ArsR/SmtB family transcription factor [Planctomycetota bacterium]
MISGTNPTPGAVDDVVRVLRILADNTRVRVLMLLRSGELNVSALCDRLDLAQPTVSHHLGLLRTVGLVYNRRAGKQIFYALSPETVSVLDNGEGLSIDTGTIKMMIHPVDAPHGTAGTNGHANGQANGHATNGALAGTGNAATTL